MSKIDLRSLDLDEVEDNVLDEQFLDEHKREFMTKTKHQSGYSSTHHKKQGNKVKKDKYFQDAN